MQEKNNSTRENNSTQQQERTTQLISRNETTQLNRRKQLNSSVGTKQLNSALPSTACNRLQPPTTAYNRLQPPTTACNRLQPPATAYNRLQPPATAYNRLQPPAPPAPPLQQNRLFLPTFINYFTLCHPINSALILLILMRRYVEWNHHEPEPGIYNFNGDYDLPRFLKTAHDLNMLVILRTGPFIDAERDMGGLPYWLLRVDPKMKMRFYDSNFIKYIDKWYNVLLPIIEPFLYNNGGPIISIQIENEYGYCGCDQYKAHLRDLFNTLLKKKVVLFTTDQPFPDSLACGKTYDVLATTDYGAGKESQTLKYKSSCLFKKNKLETLYATGI
ncbi:beta-galactosidase-1-like protein [Trichonephila clavipes]|nr:beta-galactosidase-1-like protein [Trichonephila clavipes]